MRKPVLIATIAAVNLMVALGCTGGLMASEPKFERAYFRAMDLPPEAFKTMDLPYYGGQVEKSAEGFMEVSYRDELTIDQIVELWPAALEAEGWGQTEGGRNPNQGFTGFYDTPDGSRGTLTVKPTGSLWTVLLSKTPPED